MEYFNAEAFEALVAAWFAFDAVLIGEPDEEQSDGLVPKTLAALAETSGYRVDRLRALLSTPEPEVPSDVEG